MHETIGGVTASAAGLCLFALMIYMFAKWGIKTDTQFSIKPYEYYELGIRTWKLEIGNWKLELGNLYSISPF